MLLLYKQKFRSYLEQCCAFQGRSFSFQLLTLAAIAVCLTIIANGLYHQFYPKPIAGHPTAFTATILPK